MAEHKTVFRYFTIPQYRREEEFLSSMHERGWRLVRVGFPGFYHFERCVPERAAYRLDFNREGIRNQSEYVQMFSDCGWEYLFDFMGYSYFRKVGGEHAGAEEIFSDDASRIDMMKRVFKGRIILMFVIFFCLILPLLIMNLRGSYNRTCEILSYVFLGFAGLYLLLFGVTGYQFYRLERKVKPDHPGIRYKYGGLAALLLLGIIGLGTVFYIGRRSDYSVYERTDGFEITADWMNDSVVMEYDLKKGAVIAVEPEYRGELSIAIGKKNDPPVFTGHSYRDMFAFSVEITEDGRYQIECASRGGKGRIRITIR